jgi:hypothetical protein
LDLGADNDFFLCRYRPNLLLSDVALDLGAILRLDLNGRISGAGGGGNGGLRNGSRRQDRSVDGESKSSASHTGRVNQNRERVYLKHRFEILSEAGQPAILSPIGDFLARHRAFKLHFGHVLHVMNHLVHQNGLIRGTRPGPVVGQKDGAPAKVVKSYSPTSAPDHRLIACAHSGTGVRVYCMFMAQFLKPCV